MSAARPVARLLRAVVGKGRRQRRTARASTVHLFADAKYLGEAKLVDESRDGAQISARSAHTLRLATHALDPKTGEVKQLRLAWRDGLRAGFRYTAVHQIRGYMSDPGMQGIKEAWISLSMRASPAG